MTTFNISDLMDGLGDEALDLADPGVTSPERVLALVRERSGQASAAPAWHAKAKKTRRLGRTLLIAALLAALMGVTAYAVYELVIDRYVIEQPAWYASEEAAEQPDSRVSLVGYQGTPEYLAYTEWDALQEQWFKEDMAFWQERGADDSYHEAPDNYYGFYSVVTQAQADQLDAIMEKYGLTAHTAMAFIVSAAELYDALGTESFYSDALAGESAGYIYDDGTFKDEGRSYVFPDGREVGLRVFVSAKGSFSTISGYIDLSQGYEEWSYTTASGVTVDMVLTPDSGERILAETDGAYIDVGVGRVRTREELQTIADCIGFDALADRFDGQPHPETAEKVAALDETYKEREKARQAAAAEDAAQVEETSREVIDRLGAFAVTALPEGYESIRMLGVREQGPIMPWTEQEIFDQVTRTYYNEEMYGYIRLDAFRFYTDGGRTASATAEALEDTRAHFCGTDGPVTEIQGWDGFVYAEELSDTLIAIWYDRDRDLMFLLDCLQTGLDADGVLALAESVAEKAYAPETAAPAENAELAPSSEFTDVRVTWAGCPGISNYIPGGFWGPVGSEYAMTLSFAPADPDAVIEWKSDNENAVTVDDNGYIQIIGDSAEPVTIHIFINGQEQGSFPINIT